MKKLNMLRPMKNTFYSLLIFCVAGTCAPIRAMDLRLRCADGREFSVDRQDALLFGFIKEKLSKKLDTVLNIPTVKLTGISACKSQSVGALFQILKGASAGHLNDDCLRDACLAAYFLKAPEQVTSQLERVALSRGLQRWAAERCNVCAQPMPGQIDNVGLLSLPLMQQNVSVDGVLDLRCMNLQSIAGAIFSPSQQMNIVCIDLSNNNLAEQGLDALKSFGCLPNVRCINLANNQITTIPSNIMMNVPHCEAISFASNAIQRIERDAFKGAHDCLINICENPIHTVDSEAFTQAFPHVSLMCSKSLSAHILHEFNQQLSQTNKNDKYLLGYAVTRKLLANGWIKCFMLSFLFVEMALFLSPIAFILIRPDDHPENITPMVPGLFVFGISVGVISTIFAYHKVLDRFQQFCERNARKRLNEIRQLTTHDAQIAQRKLFEA